MYACILLQCVLLQCFIAVKKFTLKSQHSAGDVWRRLTTLCRITLYLVRLWRHGRCRATYWASRRAGEGKLTPPQQATRSSQPQSCCPKQWHGTTLSGWGESSGSRWRQSAPPGSWQRRCAPPCTEDGRGRQRQSRGQKRSPTDWLADNPPSKWK